MADLHTMGFTMGFEIGNHTWSHESFSAPERVVWLRDELAGVERAMDAVGVPRPVSFAWPANGFCPEAVGELAQTGATED